MVLDHAAGDFDAVSFIANFLLTCFTDQVHDRPN